VVWQQEVGGSIASIVFNSDIKYCVSDGAARLRLVIIQTNLFENVSFVRRIMTVNPAMVSHNKDTCLYVLQRIIRSS